ncbi:MFS transporter [Hutsoniella sourekii]|uniref:MFS transporter n=1 Tax=Hutsoniella sourekii TaxID=87650 RepID=UPI0004848876|nr:MFS transporter [Hutsoniella sourekii]
MRQQAKHYRTFLILWLGQLIAATGHGVSSFAIGIYVYRLSQQATAISMVSLAAFLPSIILAPLAGILADRFDRRMLMMLADGVSSLGLISILWLYYLGQLHVWHVLMGVTFSSVFQALLEPAYRATVSDILPEEDYANASGLVQLASSAKFLVAPAIGGYLMTRPNGISLALLLDILTILVTLATTQWVRHRLGQVKFKKQSESLWQDFKAGSDYLLEHSGILTLMLLAASLTCYLGSIQILIQPLALSITNSQTLGQVISLGAIGMLLSSLLVGWRGIPAGKELSLLRMGMVICGLFIIGLGLSRSVASLTLSCFLIFLTLPVMTSSLETLMRLVIPSGIQGRVWGILSFLSQMGYLIAYLLSGPLADYVFEPLLLEGGLLASTPIDNWLGIGPGRGIGLLFVLAGTLLLLTASLLMKNKPISLLRRDLT